MVLELGYIFEYLVGRTLASMEKEAAARRWRREWFRAVRPREAWWLCRTIAGVGNNFKEFAGSIEELFAIVTF